MVERRDPPEDPTDAATRLAEGAVYDPLPEETPPPMLEFFGARLTVWSDGYARVEAPIGPRMLNRQGIIHGGLLMTLMDSAGGYAGCWLPIPGRWRKAKTVSMTTNFVAVARGVSLSAEARVTGAGRSMFFADIDIRDDLDVRIAHGSGVFKYRSTSMGPEGEPRP